MIQQEVCSRKLTLFHHNRYMNFDKWRKEFGVDDICQNFVYVEKPKVFEYYPQYYHKTDKVPFPSLEPPL